MELINKSNKHFNFPFAQHAPNEKKKYDEKVAKNILDSYPGHFEEVEPEETAKKTGGTKKCRK